MAGGVEGSVADKTFDWFSWLFERFGAVGTGFFIHGIVTVVELVLKDSLVEGRDIMTMAGTKAEKKIKQKMFYEPYSSNIAIGHDSSSLKLNKACCVMQMDCNGGTHTIRVP